MNYNQLERDIRALSPIKAKSFKESRLHLIDHLVDKCPVDGMICEFGVRSGVSLSRIAKAFNQPVYGFDSFEGLPEPWDVADTYILPKGEGRQQKLPEIHQTTLIKGWFEDTLPTFEFSTIRLAHIDCDIYSGTVTILKHIKPFLVKDSVLLFDELIQFESSSYQNWRKHEWKALMESGIEVRPLARTDAEQVALYVV